MKRKLLPLVAALGIIVGVLGLGSSQPAGATYTPGNQITNHHVVAHWPVALYYDLNLIQTPSSTQLDYAWGRASEDQAHDMKYFCIGGVFVDIYGTIQNGTWECGPGPLPNNSTVTRASFPTWTDWVVFGVNVTVCDVHNECADWQYSVFG